LGKNIKILAFSRFLSKKSLMAGKKTQKRIQNPSLTGEIPYGQF
jgi:hypothetical protein